MSKLNRKALNEEIKGLEDMLRQQNNPNAEIRLRDLLLIKETDARVGLLILTMEEILPDDHIIFHSANYKWLSNRFK